MDALTAAVAQVEQAVMAIDGVDTVLSDIGEEGASIVVNFVAAEERPANLTVSRVREAALVTAKRIKGFEVLRQARIGSAGKGRKWQRRRHAGRVRQRPREVVLSGPESIALERLAEDVVARLDAVPSVARAWQWAAAGSRGDLGGAEPAGRRRSD